MTDAASLEELRTLAGLSQADMASYLGISQSQVSRCELNPDEVTVGVDRRWRAYCGEILSAQPLNYGDAPLKEVHDRHTLIQNYLDAAEPAEPAELSGDEFLKESGISPVSSLTESFNRIARKPRVGIFGRSDMGKSKLANMLLGSDSLPAKYRPTTRLACLVRHIDDKPEWQAEPVWVMGRGFKIDAPDDQKNCEDHKVLSGSLGLLQDYCSYNSPHEDSPEMKKAVTAVIYVDSPFLLGCDLVDVPGYQNKDDDDKRAELATRIVDIMIYVSHVNGFVDVSDRGYLSQLIRQLPAYETSENDLAPLRNLFVVMTRADTAKGADHNDLLRRAAEDLFNQIEPTLEDRALRTNRQINLLSLGERFFTYTAEEPKLRAKFEDDLRHLLGEVAPRRVLESLDSAVRLARQNSSQEVQSLIETIEKSIRQREMAQAEIKNVLANEGERKKKKEEAKTKVEELIEQLRQESLDETRHVYQEMVEVGHIESMIRSNYQDKKAAQSLAPGRFIEKLRQSIDRILSQKGETLTVEINKYLGRYETVLGEDSVLASSWQFNAKGAFIMALSSAGTFGALAAWASVVAAGSNLGGYILVAKVVSALAAIGIDLGGTATVITAISYVGGPITIAIGIALTVGLALARLFGDSWQLALAKKINKEMRSKKVLSAIEKQIDKHWDDTIQAFGDAADQTEKDYRQKLKQLEDIAFNTDIAVLETRRNYLQELRDFFAGIPWRAIG